MLSTMESPDDVTSSSSPEEREKRNRQIIDRFLHSIRSDATRHNALHYMHIYMRFWHLYEEKTASELLMEVEEEKEETKETAATA
jgi:uncharacterized membrane protein